MILLIARVASSPSSACGAVYFGGAELLAVSHISATSHPIHSVHMGSTSFCGVLADPDPYRTGPGGMDEAG